MLDYNVPGGKLNRGLAVADVLSVLQDGQVVPHRSHHFGTWQSALLQNDTFDGMAMQATDEATFKANVLGWCIEWVCPTYGSCS